MEHGSLSSVGKLSTSLSTSEWASALISAWIVGHVLSASKWGFDALNSANGGAA